MMDIEKQDMRALHRMYHDFRYTIDKLQIPALVRLAEETGAVKLMLEGDKAVGFLMVIDGYIEAIYVAPDHRRRGIARRAVLDYIGCHGLPNTLHTINTNKAAKKFWHGIFDMHKVSQNDIDTLWQIDGLRPGL